MDNIHTDPILHQASVLDEINHIVEVTIIKPGESKVTIDGTPVSYTEDALKNSLSLWEGTACFCDHFNKSVRNIAGVFFSPWYDEGVKAKLRFIDDTLYNMVSRIVADRENSLPVPDIGISADIAINGESSDDTFEVREISRVISADIVFSPAAGGSFDRILNSVMQELAIGDDQDDQLLARHGESVDRVASGDPLDTPGATPPGGEPLVSPKRVASGDPEKRVRDLQSAADRLRNQVKNQEATIQELQGNLAEAVSRYRESLLAQHPEIPADLLKGSTIAELDASLENAQAVVDNVKQHLAEKVPAGAPARQGINISSMSPGEKISYGLKQRGITR